MQVIMMIIQVLQRTAIGYGKMFMLIGTIIEEGTSVFNSTVEVLGQEKYKHVKAHFQAAILHVIAAMAEFKKGGKAFEAAVLENPDDFKVMTDFAAKLKKELPEQAEECFKGLGEILKSEGDKLKPKVPAFIRESGEYMELVNHGYIEVDEATFKEILVKETEGMPEYRLSELGEAYDSIQVKGWAKYVTLEKKDGEEIIHRYILWADDFKFDELIPKGAEVVQEAGKDTFETHFVKAGPNIYKVDRFEDLKKEIVNPEEVVKTFDEKFKDGLK